MNTSISFVCFTGKARFLHCWNVTDNHNLYRCEHGFFLLPLNRWRHCLYTRYLGFSIKASTHSKWQGTSLLMNKTKQQTELLG